MNQEVYPKAPIVEASFDIRVRIPASTSWASLADVKDPNYQSLFNKPTRMEIKIEANQGGPSSVASTSNTPLGYSYKSADGLRVFQVRSDGFTHNELAPYGNWSDFSNEAKRLWSVYKAGAHPEFVELVGLTYLNEFQLPMHARFEDYLAVYLHVPENLPQDLNTFTFGLQTTDTENDCLVHIGQGYGLPKTEGFASVRLTIQAFKQLNSPVSEVSDEKLWTLFEQLRASKNKVFEASITDKTRIMIR